MKFSPQTLLLILTAGSSTLAASPTLRASPILRADATSYTEDFTSSGTLYSASYIRGSDSDGNAALDITLSLYYYDATWITTTDGSEGVWMAVGFNSNSMSGANVVYCYITYTGSASDDFSCVDAVNSGYNGPVDLDDQTYITGVTTI